MTWQHSASWSGILITQILSDLAQEIVDYFCFCQHEVIFLVWWFLVDQSWRQRGKRQIKSIWKYFPHASFKQYTANLYFVSNNRVDELETDSNQIGATAKCATHTGRCDHRGILAGWVGGVLKAKVSDGKVGKRLKPNSWPYLDCPYNPICPCNCCKHLESTLRRGASIWQKQYSCSASTKKLLNKMPQKKW